MRKLVSLFMLTVILLLGVTVLPGKALAPEVSLPVSADEWLKPTPQPGSSEAKEEQLTFVANAIGGRSFEDTHPAVAFNSQVGEYLVVFESQRDDPGPGPSDILGQRVALDGTPLGSLLYLATASSSNLYAPDVAYNSTQNQYLLVYQSEHYENDIYAQRLLGDGTPTGGTIFIATNGEEDRAPAVAFNSAVNQYLIVWETFSGGEMGQYDIYGRRVDAIGGVFTQFLISTANILDDLNPAVVSGQGYLVVWQSESGDEIYDIHGWRLANDGSFLENELVFSAQGYTQANPRVAYAADNYTFLVVWQYDYYGSGSDWDIYGQRVYTSGGLAGNAFVINDSPTNMINPDVAYHANAHEYMVALEYYYSLSDPDIYYQRVDSNGALAEGLNSLAASAYKQTHPRLAGDNAWSYLAVWEDTENADSPDYHGTDIFGDALPLGPLSGQVWAGGVGKETTPVAGVTIRLYCSSSADLGPLIESRQTDGTGTYYLPVAGYCSYYDIVEIDNPGYLSAGATSVGGEVLGENRIRYTYPLQGKTLSNNDFYDHPPSGITHCNSCSDCNAKLNGTYSLVYLDNDIETHDASCINFAASNTTFDCQGHKITGIISGGEFYHGITMSYRAQNTVRSCWVKGFPSGISLQNSTYNTLAGNILSQNGSGIYLNGSSHNQLTGNLVGPNDDGMALWSSNNNALSGNMVCKNTRDIVLPNANSGNTRSGDMCDAIYGWNWNGSDPPPLPQWCDQTCTPNQQTTCSSPQSCLDALDGHYNLVTLNTDLSLPDGLPITGNHLTLDCTNHTLNGAGTGVGISLEDRLDVTVQRCRLQNYGTGIELHDTSLSTVYQNTLWNNDTGIALTGNDPLYLPRQNEVSGNLSNGNALYGLWLNNAWDNNINSNNLSNNGSYGLWVSDRCNNSVIGNTSGNGSSLLYWHDASNAGTLPVMGYGQVFLCNVQNAVIENLVMNSGATQGDGIAVLNSSSIQLRNNNLNHTNGIYVAGSQQLTIANNTIQNSRRNALELSNCNGCMVRNNTLDQNPGLVQGTGTGLYISNGSPLLQLLDNTVTNNSLGIWLQDVSSPYVSGNTIRDNDSTGLFADGTAGLAFYNNNVRGNDYGVEFDVHSSANLQGNNICYNKTLDILNENTSSTGSGNECITVSNWADSGVSGQGCSQKCIGWYPYQYGYYFENLSKSWLSYGCPYGSCQGDYTDTFGVNQVYQTLDLCIGIPVCLPFVGCACVGYETKVPTPFPEPNALVYYFAAYGYAASPGSCQGMSTTSLRFFYGDKLVTEYGPSAEKVSDLPYWGDLEDAIDAAQGANRSVELLKNFMANVSATQPNTVLSQVRQSLAAGHPAIIIEYHLGGGHAVVATDVRDIDANTSRIYIYDSNYPEYTTQYGESEEDYDYITIHTDTNSWEYANQGENDQIWFMPYSTVAGGYTLPISWEGDIFAAWGEVNSLVTDPDGQQVGWSGGQLVSEIPQAYPYPQIGDSEAYDPGQAMYILPRGVYTATLSGTGTGAYNAAVFAGNQLLMLDNVLSTPATQDTLAFYHENDDPPSGGFSFTSFDTSKPFTATISELFGTSDSNRVYSLRDCNSVPGESALFSISPDFNSLRFTNRASTSMVCTVELKNTMTSDAGDMAGDFPKVTQPRVVVPGMTTAIFTPSDWLDLNHATINVSLLCCGDNVCSVGEDRLGCPEDCQQPACMTPADDLHLSGSTVLCPASYELPDQGSKGVIIIDVDDMTLNCNGARLIGDGTGVGILAADRSNVTITGCTLQGYAAGIGIKDTADVQIQSSAVISNTTVGIYGIGSEGVQIQQSYLAANHTGIDLTDASGAQLSSNLICGSTNLDILASSQAAGIGHGNRCQSVSNWHDQGALVCRYPCAVYTRFYLPMVRR